MRQDYFPSGQGFVIVLVVLGILLSLALVETVGRIGAIFVALGWIIFIMFWLRPRKGEL